MNPTEKVLNMARNTVRALQPKPHIRVQTGRRIALTAIAVYCATRALAYSPGLVGGDMGQVVSMVSLGGALVWVWALAWAAAAILCVTDMVEGHTRRGLSLAIGLGLAWGAAYGIAWIANGINTGEWTTWWVTAVNYLTVSAAIGGLTYKVTALRDMVNPSGVPQSEE